MLRLQVFKSTFEEMINKSYSFAVDIESYQSVLEYKISKVDFSVGNLNLSIGKTVG